MNGVVVPLSAPGVPSRDPLWVGMSVVVHMVLIGIPIAPLIRRAMADGEPGDGGRVAA